MKTKYDLHGALYINTNGNLVDCNNKGITLTCFSVRDSQAKDSSSFRKELEQLRNERNLDGIYFPISALGSTGYCYMDSLSRKEVRIHLDNTLKAATELGLYIIIQLQSDSETTANSTSRNDNITFSSTDMEILSDFFQRTAKRYQAYGNVLYELQFPGIVDSCINSFIENIRQYDAYAIIMHHIAPNTRPSIKGYNLAYAPLLYEKAISITGNADESI